MPRKIGKYLLFTYLISWSAWAILGYITKATDIRFGELSFMILFTLGGLGPTIAAFIVKSPRIDKAEFRLFIGEVFKVKVSPLWYVYIFGLPFMLFSIPYIVNHNSIGYGITLFRKPVYLLFSLIFSNILFGGLEELGWRGILLPEFLKKFSLFTSSIFTSVIWSLWHLPLWFIEGSPQKDSNFLVFLILGLCFSFILSTVYVRTKSIFLCVMAHSLINSYSGIMNLAIVNVYRELFIMLISSFAVFIIFSGIRKDTSKSAAL